MMSNTHHDQDMRGRDMETLSALFDDELEGDAARFAMKRLGHDPQWRQAIGNWQLLGDALRGQAGGVAPEGFAARMAIAISAEPAGGVGGQPALVPTAAVGAATMTRRKWLGGAALAASVAVVAMFVARPFSQDSSTTPGGVTTAPTELATVPTPIQAPPAELVRASPDAALPMGAAALAVAEAPRRAGERRSRGQSQRAAKRRTAAPAIASAAAVVAVSGSLHSAANPFRPQQVEVISRPWPRATLPGSPTTGVFTASFGSGATSSPSFYPFEPSLPTTVTDTTSVPVGVDERRR